MSLPRDLHAVASLRQIEAAAIAAGTPGYTLMERAGASALEVLRQHWPLARRVVVVAGPGNNGGDGLVLARLAQQAGLSVTVLLAADPARLRGEAQQAHAALLAAGLRAEAFDAARLQDTDVIVDALLGIGARGPLPGEWVRIIEAINHSGRPVLALDVPSGLDADGGRALPAVRASATVTFLACKAGLWLGEGPDHAGEIEFDALDVEVPAGVVPVLRRIESGWLGEVLPARPRQSHKSRFGRVLVVGGGTGMPGAARLAAEAALCAGAGLVTVASLPEHLAPIVGARPELMFRAIRSAADLAPALAAADVVAVGPGLGREPWAQEVLDAVLGARVAGQRLVVDADALNLLAASGATQARADWVLTPHPGEAARLLGCTTDAVQADRPAAAARLAQRWGGVVVLKGAASLVAAAGAVPWLCERGNPGMAVPGMGDVLTGAVAALLSQVADPLDATAAAVFAHATAGDRCARLGVRGMFALDVAHELRTVLAPFP